MKKFITGILTLLVAICCFAGCGLFNSNSSVTYDAEAAGELLKTTVKGYTDPSREDYEVPTQIVYDGGTYTITWTVEIDQAYINAVKVVTGDEGATKAKIDIDEAAETDIRYTLVYTISDPNGTTATGRINRTLSAAPSIVPSAITSAPVDGKAYKLYMWQVTKKDHSYFIGSMSGFYLATDSDYTKAVDVYVETVDGKENTYYMYFNDGVNNQYIGISNTYSTKQSKWYNNPIIATSFATPSDAYNATFYWNWNSEYQIMTATYDAKSGKDADTTDTSSTTVYLGTSGTYWTFGASTMNFVTSDDSCIGKLVEMVDKSNVSADDKIAAAKAAIDVQTTFNGEAVVELPDKDTTYPEVSIAWSIKEGTSAANVTLANNKLTINAPTSAVNVTLVATLSYSGKTDTLEIKITSNPAATNVTAPAENTAYKMYMYNVSLEKTLYITGETSGSDGKTYLKTTTSAKAGIDVYAKVVSGGYQFYIVKDGTNQYLNATLVKTETKTNVYLSFADSTTVVFQYAEAGYWYVTMDNSDYYLGTYGTFETIGTSSTYYVTGDNAANLGVSQYAALFVPKTTAEANDNTNTDSSSSDSSSTTDPVEMSTIAEVLAGTAGTTYKTSGTIIATHTYGFIIKDTTAAILVYGVDTTNNAYVIGDVVTVEGATMLYSGVNQLATNLTVTKTGTATVTQPTAEEITSEKATFMASSAAYEIKLITIEGDLSISGYYHNITISGTSAQGSIQRPTDLSAYNGKTIKATGYWVGISSSKYINIMLTSIEEVPTSGNDNSSSSSDSSSSDVVDSSSSDSSSSEVQLPEANSEITIEKALEIAATKEHNTYTTDKYYVTGTIESIYGAQYGNMYIQDANGNKICVYGLYSADGKIRFDAMTNQPVVGEVIKVYGVLGQYNDTKQLKNAWLSEIVTETNAGKANRAALPMTLTTTSTTETCEVTLPTAENANVAWTLSDTTYATIESGVLKITSMPSETTILTLTATVSVGEGDEKADKVKDFTFELKVVKTNVTETTITVDFTAQSYTNQQVFSSLTQDSLTITAAKNNGSTDPAYYTTGTAIRIYGGNTISFAVTTGTIKSITITTHKDKKMTADNSSTENGTLSHNGTTSTLTTTGDPSTITIKNPQSSGHIRIQKVVVVIELPAETTEA